MDGEVSGTERDRAPRWVVVGLWCLMAVSFVVPAAIVLFGTLIIGAGMALSSIAGDDPTGVFFLGGIAAIGSGATVAVLVARASRGRPADQLRRRAVSGYLSLGSVVLIAAIAMGPGMVGEGLSPQDEDLLAQVPANLSPGCSTEGIEGSPLLGSYEVGVGIDARLDCYEDRGVSILRLASSVNQEAMNRYYSLQLDEQIATARFYEQEGIGRPGRDTTKGIGLNSTPRSFFEDCRRYGAAEESYELGERSGRVWCLWQRGGGGSTPGLIWTDDRAVVVWEAIGDIAALSEWWPEEWLPGRNAQG